MSETRIPRYGENLPDQETLGWRIGTWSSFRADMLAALPTVEIPSGPNEGTRPLAALATREPDDPSIAIIDAWACALDVLTFYQERILNEGFVETATEARSVAWLARHLGHTRIPDVAASAWLKLTVREADSVADPIAVPAGSKVLSVPGVGEVPQTFETQADLDCHKSLNEFLPRQTKPFSMNAADIYFDLSGTDAGKTLLIEGINLRINVGDRMALLGPGATFPFNIEDASTTDVTTVDYVSVSVSEIEEDKQRNWTRVGIAGTYAVPDHFRSSSTIQAHVYRVRTRGFASAAPYYRYDISSLVNIPTSSTPLFGQTIPTAPGVYVVQVAGDHPKVFAGQLAEFWYYDESSSLTTTATVYRSKFPTQVVAAETRQLSNVAWEVSGAGTELAFVFVPTDVLTWTDHRGLQAFLQSERLTFAEVPRTGELYDAEDPDWIPIEEDIPELTVGKKILFTSGDVSELAEIADVGAAGERKIQLTAALTYAFQVESTTIHGNVVRATHGETASEVLGSGDASTPYQELEVRGSPVLWVTPEDGAEPETSLGVTVNGLDWSAVTDMREYGPSDRIFREELDDEENTVLRFGDGIVGARLPTGVDNVVATYRKGVGDDGNVDAKTLTIGKGLPPGISAVTNPIAASGGSSPETAASLRASMLQRVALRDRLVSAPDIVAFAEEWDGVTMATWESEFVGEELEFTVSVLFDALVEADWEDTLAELETAIRDRMTDDISLVVRAARRRYCAAVIAYESGNTVAPQTIYDALATAFALESRSLLQPLNASEIVAVVSAIPGILDVSVTLSKYDHETPSSTVVELVLPYTETGLEQVTAAGEDELTGAELVILDLGDPAVDNPQTAAVETP